MGVVIRDVTRGLATWARARREGLNMAEDLTCRESDYDSDCADSLGSSKSESELSLSCEFSPFDSGSEGAIEIQIKHAHQSSHLHFIPR